MSQEELSRHLFRVQLARVLMQRPGVGRGDGGNQAWKQAIRGRASPHRAGDPGIAPAQPTSMQGSPTVEPGRHVAGPGGTPA